MDPVQQQSPPQNIPSPVPPQSPLPADNSQKTRMPLMLLAVILVIALVGVGVLTLSRTRLTKKIMQITPTPSLASTPLPSEVVTQIPTVISPSVIPSLQTGKISAGIQTQIFTPYTITLSSGWTPTHESDPAAKTDKLVISKGGSSLTISQAAGGAGSCIFPGDTPQPMSQSFTNYVDITGTTPPLRRGANADDTISVCESTSAGFAFPTSYGYITYILADPTDKSTLTEIDLMVATLTKQ